MAQHVNSITPSGGLGGNDDDSQPSPRNCYRLVMLGSARVGKTSLVSRFLGGQFEDCYTPTIEDFHRKLYRIRGEIHQLDILDTSGNHPFPAMRRLSFLTGDLFVIVFSMDVQETYEEAIRLREQILEIKSSMVSSGTRSKKHIPKVPMILVGNKCDIDNKNVSISEVDTYVSSQDANCIFSEVSAKTNYNVDELFYELFSVAGLPPEMAPNHHKRVKTTFGAPCILPQHSPSNRNKKTLTIKRRLSDAYGVIETSARRPSVRTDLLIMRSRTIANNDNESSSTSSGRSNPTVCNIQ